MIKRSKSIPIFNKNKKKDFQNKMAVKLMNEYAENYKYLEKQYKQLKQELSDTKTNLQISKEIIDVFMTKCSDPKLKISEIIKSLNKKVNWYHDINTKLVEDNTTLNNLVNKHNLNLSKITSELDYLKTKYFILEQSIKKKDNIIKNLKNCSEIKEKYNLVVIKPTTALLKLNSELENYKELFYKVYRNAKKYKEKLEFYEKQVNFLQTEKEKLRVKNREQKMQANKDKDNIFLYLRKTLTNIALNDKSFNKSFNILKSDNNVNNIGSLNILGNLNKSALNKTKGNEVESLIDNKLLESFMKTENSFYENKNKNKVDINNDDFVEILKQAGLTQDDFIEMSKNPANAKLTDVIEFMYKMITDKTQTINLLECENENLNQENFELNKKNMELMKNKEVDDSLISNSSKITIKNVNINTLSNYQKILYNNTSNVQEEINKIFRSKTPDNTNNNKDNKENKDKENDKINKQDIKNNININIIKNNFKKTNEEINNDNNYNNKKVINNQKFLGQLSFTSINSSEVDKEIGANSFLSDSSENDNN
jgi:hypothetical protein